MTQEKQWQTFDEATVLARAGQWQAAIERYEALLRQSLPDDLRAHLHNDLGVAHQSVGALQRAAEHFRQSYDIYERARNRLGAAIALGNLGTVHRQRREWEEAIHCLERSVVVFDNLEIDNGAVAKLRVDLGDALAATGKPKAAAQEYALALRRQEADGDTRAQALTLHALGVAQRARLRWEDGIAALERACALFEELGDRASLAATLNRLGELHYERRDYAGAVNAYLRDLEINETLQNRRAIAQTANNLGMARLALGQFETAAEDFRRALSLAEQLDDDHGAGLALWGRAQLAHEQDEPEAALKEGERARARFERAGSKQEEEAARKWLSAVRRGKRKGLRRYL